MKQKMPLAGSYLPQNVDRPRSRGDFDIKTGVSDLRFVEDSMQGSKWRTPLSHNLTGFVLLVVSLSAVGILSTAAPSDWVALPLFVQIVIAFFGCLLLIALYAGTLLLFYRRQLIIDHVRGELRFCKWADRPFLVIPMADIRAMSFENIQHVGGSDVIMQDGSYSSTTSTHVLLAELQDGRLLPISFRPPGRLFEYITNWTRQDMWESEQSPAGDVPKAAREA